MNFSIVPGLTSYITDTRTGVGREVIDALIAAKKHTIIVLTRKVRHGPITVVNGSVVTLTSLCRILKPKSLHKASLGSKSTTTTPLN